MDMAIIFVGFSLTANQTAAWWSTMAFFVLVKKKPTFATAIVTARDMLTGAHADLLLLAVLMQTLKVNLLNLQPIIQHQLQLQCQAFSPLNPQPSHQLTCLQYRQRI